MKRFHHAVAPNRRPIPRVFHKWAWEKVTRRHADQLFNGPMADQSFRCPGLTKSALSEFHFQPPEIGILYNGKSFPVVSLLACSLSRRLNFLIQSDPLCKEFAYCTTNSGDFTPVCQCLLLMDFTIHPSEIPFLLQVAAELQIDSLADQVGELLTDAMILELPLEYFEHIYASGGNCECFIPTLALFFDDLDHSKLAKWPFELLDLLFQSGCFVTAPEKLLEFLQSAFDFADRPNCRLIRHLPFASMTEDQKTAFVRSPGLNVNRLRACLLDGTS
jgi:hypothetical protein